MFWLLRRGSGGRKARGRERASYRPGVEALERREMFYALSGFSWSDTNVSASFMPDGTATDQGAPSNLFATLNASFSTAVWQRELARVLQTWASVTPLNFHFVADTGVADNVSGKAQGDSRFGDIRFGGYAKDLSIAAEAYYPYGGGGATDPYNWMTLGGDAFLNTAQSWHIGSYIDLYSVLLHETGHAIGLDHSSLSSAVMYPYYSQYSGLSADDIAGVQAIYGARLSDAYDAAAPNNTLNSASVLTLSSGMAHFQADLTSIADIDYYRFTAPAGTDGSLTVSVNASNLSLLGPKVSVYNAAGILLGQSAVGIYGYGTVATVSVGGLTAGQTYYVVADGATDDVFGMGAYVLDAQFGTGAIPAPSSPSGLSATATSTSQVNLTWQDNATSEDGFRIEQSADGINFTAIATVGPNATSYAATGLSAGTTYYFRVYAYNGGGDSAASNITQATTLTATLSPPQAPSGLAATATSTSQVNLTWQDNATNEDGFRIEQSTDGINFTAIATVGPNATSYAATGLSAGTTYYFRTRAYNAAGDSTSSNTAQATTFDAALALAPDQLETNDTFKTAASFGKTSSVIEIGLTLHTSSDVDFFMFMPKSSGNYTVSIASTQAQGNIDLAVFDSHGGLIARSATSGDIESLTLNLSNTQKYYIEVYSSVGDQNAYNLSIAKATELQLWPRIDPPVILRPLPDDGPHTQLDALWLADDPIPQFSPDVKRASFVNEELLSLLIGEYARAGRSICSSHEMDACEDTKSNSLPSNSTSTDCRLVDVFAFNAD